MVKCTPCILFYIFFTRDFLGSSTEKNTQQFQALNGLKCSTVGIGAGAIELAGARAPKISDSGGTEGTTEFMGHL